MAAESTSIRQAPQKCLPSNDTLRMIWLIVIMVAESLLSMLKALMQMAAEFSEKDTFSNVALNAHCGHDAV